MCMCVSVSAFAKSRIPLELEYSYCEHLMWVVMDANCSPPKDCPHLTTELSFQFPTGYYFLKVKLLILRLWVSLKILESS